MTSKNQSKGNQSGKSQRGFASMDPNQQREIASEGGKAAHQAGTAHEFTSEEARRAGQMSHKNDASRSSSSGNRGSESGSKSRSGGSSSGNKGSESGSKTRGGSSEQHAQAGRQSHKNDK